ncbi:hypothetical protein ACF1AE_21440 [Streptomyces sp. NPDC014986]|uniref:hypothetical protein n=1 Tax=Streptomyces sp. NPDC014986 TaxID=3364934 RepID=UPI0036F8EC37
MPTAAPTTPGTCRTVMALYLTPLDHTAAVDTATARQAAHHTELQLGALNRSITAVYVADVTAALRTDPAAHQARLAWARALAAHLTVRP